VMGWGSKAIEIRAVENGQLDGVFMHKRTQKLRFLCERNDKVKGGLWVCQPEAVGGGCGWEVASSTSSSDAFLMMLSMALHLSLVH